MEILHNFRQTLNS